MVFKRGRIKYFDTERQAENFVKRHRMKFKQPGLKPSIQGNAVVMIPIKKKKFPTLTKKKLRLK